MTIQVSASRRLSRRPAQVRSRTSTVLLSRRRGRSTPWRRAQDRSRMSTKRWRRQDNRRPGRSQDRFRMSTKRWRRHDNRADPRTGCLGDRGSGAGRLPGTTAPPPLGLRHLPVCVPGSSWKVHRRGVHGRGRRPVLARHPAARVRRILQHGHRDGGGLLWRREVPRRGRRLLQVDFLPRAGHNFMMTLITTLPVVPHRSRPAKIRWLIHSESAWNSAGNVLPLVLRQIYLFI